jgi:hypothetical protein
MSRPPAGRKAATVLQFQAFRAPETFCRADHILRLRFVWVSVGCGSELTAFGTVAAVSVGGLRLSPFFIVTEVLKVFLVDAYFGVVG